MLSFNPVKAGSDELILYFPYEVQDSVAFDHINCLLLE